MRRNTRAAVSATHVHSQVSDNERLKKSTDGKRRLTRCIWAQATLQIIKAGLIAYAFSQHDRVAQSTAAACAFAMVAIVSGYLGLERGSLNLLKAYILCMAIAATLAAYPLYRQGCKGTGWSIYQRTAGDKHFASLKQLEGVQDVLSVTTQVLGLGIATNLLKYFTPEKRRL
ncbi:hypothetical protein Mp_3g17760 [Marchantia polymorpha subsp. ruderalis]|uniref:Uncharacterized protein n=2 Tax=Marchantia polymorpha TaxID=3197 RepID=A0AAF6B1Y9_MARPO|nr:hypothetical protein MARPO_0039s0020 [Marchantia polymorpha]BBN06023.1 hypothetical protein Mp_3g17760 [Marchantia polymorpha subsp. ruderalis]|eukprot:PTQ40506.1 hypothetical protein MARPO_0039s0020 [Marchantia polymorpha]